MNRDNIELFVAILSMVGTFILVILNLDNSETSVLTSWIPSIFSGWVGTVLIVISLLYFLWYILKAIGDPGLLEEAQVDMHLRELDAIEGCIQKGGVAWKGTAYLNRGEVENIEVPYKPICPKCQTGLVDRTQKPSMQEQRQNPSYSHEAQPTDVFSCPNDNCEHTVARDTDQYDEVNHLFERHAERITETRDEDYSLRSLIENIENRVTPQSVWEEYAGVVDDEQVSTNCFH